MPPKKSTETASNSDSTQDGAHLLEETDENQHYEEWAIRLQRGDPQMKAFYEFADKKEFIVPSKTDGTNFVDMMKGGRCHLIPDVSIARFFELYNSCANILSRMMVYELQRNHTGIMLDFDIYQIKNESQLNSGLFQNLCDTVIRVLFEIIEKPHHDKINIHCGIFRRPTVKYDDEKSCYKDGFHLLIPEIQVVKGVKRLLIDRLVEQEHIDNIFADVVPVEQLGGAPFARKDFLDVMSASVPVFLVNSVSRRGKRPHILVNIFDCTVTKISCSVSTKNNTTLLKQIKNSPQDYNLPYEFSILHNNAAGTALMKKERYEVNEQYAARIAAMAQRIADIDLEAERQHGILATNSIQDPLMAEMRKLLAMLADFRATRYKEWFSVLCALAHTSASYKPLAHEFSRRSRDFSAESFERFWGNAMSESRHAKLSAASIHYWAKTDNPTAYMEFRKESVYASLQTLIYLDYKRGELNHSDIAGILHHLLAQKYVNDVPEGDTHSRWFEFIFEEDPHETGELFKWHMTRKQDKISVSMSNYISTLLPKLFEMMHAKIKTRMETTQETVMKKYFQIVWKNFGKVINKLGEHAFKSNIMREAEIKFARRGFAASLDKDPFVRGVANGVIHLSNTPGIAPKLITGYHTYRISKFMPVPYVPFDPRDPETKEILYVLRNLMPDNEPDTFEFIMNYLASTLDGADKESMFVIMVGRGANGKSFLMEMHKGVLGDHYGTKMKMNYLTDFSNKTGAADPDLMKLKDVSFAYYSECNQGEVVNLARIKELTGMETVTGRALFRDMINFRPRCHHLCIQNHDFEIRSNDHGTWRRIVYIPLKITFILNPAEYDPSVPNTRPANHNVNTTWIQSDSIRGRYLGILVWYHFMFYREYGGRLGDIPKPHIDYDTAQYRRRQDKFAQFMASRLVKTADPRAATSLAREVDKYNKWYIQQFGGVNPPKHTADLFRNSFLGDHIQRFQREGDVLVGYRFVDEREPKKEDEVYCVQQESDEIAIKDNFGVPVENGDAYYAKICEKYDRMKDIFTGRTSHDNNMEMNVLSDEYDGGRRASNKYSYQPPPRNPQNIPEDEIRFTASVLSVPNGSGCMDAAAISAAANALNDMLMDE